MSPAAPEFFKMPPDCTSTRPLALIAKFPAEPSSKVVAVGTINFAATPTVLAALIVTLPPRVTPVGPVLLTVRAVNRLGEVGISGPVVTEVEPV